MIDIPSKSELFDRARRRILRDRGFARAKGRDFLNGVMVEEIIESLSLVQREFRNCLIIGLCANELAGKLQNQGIETFAADSSFHLAMASEGVQCDEDRLPFADKSFDLVVNIGSLDSVNDLPGALALTLRILKPDGLFLAAFVGAESLPVLKTSLMQAEGDKISAHIHPQIDIRTVGDLLSRVEFKLPVADSDKIRLRYPDMNGVISDIRDMGSGNILSNQTGSLPRSVYKEAKKHFTTSGENDGKTTEKIEIVYLSGWAPHPDQPKPARRGSGQMSLKTALGKQADDPETSKG